VTIAVIVTSLPTPERQPLLAEALDSVYAQTRQPDDCVVGLDFGRMSEIANFNRLIAQTDSEWIAFLHDDDLWHPDHLAVCEKHFADADVVVSRFHLVGRPVDTIEPWHTNFDDLRFTNWIGSPSMVCVRRSVFGVWHPPYGPYCWNDWANYNRLLAAGARFVDTGEVTVDYRFGDWQNGSWNG
jgi:glycosyltransferase involved in cell wall biosynthesis